MLGLPHPSCWRRPAFGLGLALLLVPAASCKSPTAYREEADEVADRIIEEKQKEALGRTEPLVIMPPAETLRRRLLLQRDLPYSHPASLGSFYLDPIPQWPDADYLKGERPTLPQVVAVPEAGPLKLTLDDALQIAARNSRDYQREKEEVFIAALDLDLERDAFRPTFDGGASGGISTDLRGDDTTGVVLTPQLRASQLFKNGTSVTSRIGLDIVRLLTDGEGSSLGLFGDASISIPLLRGSGAFIVTEPLTQAERSALYAIYDFETYKREFAVDIAESYLTVLQSLDTVQNRETSYRGYVAAARRTRRFAEAGLARSVDVGRADQQELRGRSLWILSQQRYLQALDRFKLELGLPTDADVELDPDELSRLADSVRATMASALEQPVRGGASLSEEVAAGEVAPGEVEARSLEEVQGDLAARARSRVQIEPPSQEGAGPLELPEAEAIRIALENRLDLKVQLGVLRDAERRVAIVADRFRPELSLLGSASAGERRGLGSADREDSLSLPLDEARYEALINLDLPLDRTEERNRYRATLIGLERAVRAVQALEDRVKFQVRQDLRTLQQARENIRIQAEAVRLAQRDVRGADLSLQAGRADIEDVLDAQEDLVDAQDDLTEALVDYRIAELSLQRDMGVLNVDETGLWREYVPGEDARP